MRWAVVALLFAVLCLIAALADVKRQERRDRGEENRSADLD